MRKVCVVIGSRQNMRQRGKNVVDVDHNRSAIADAVTEQIENGGYESEHIYGDGHDGSLGNAKCLIDAAGECGVDAVKFQTHIAEAETLPDAPIVPFFKGEPCFE